MWESSGSWMIPCAISAGAGWFSIVLRRGEDLGDVDRVDPRSLPVQRSSYVHEARVVRRGAVLGSGVEHAADLVREHGHRGVSVLHGERAPETAALLGVRQLDEVDSPHPAEQP